jgi:hypothetical protein
MAKIYVNFLDCPEDLDPSDIEDALRGMARAHNGKQTGAGSALDGPGFNVDLMLFSEEQAVVDQFLQVLLEYLRSLPAPPGTEVIVEVGTQPEQTYTL